MEFDVVLRNDRNQQLPLLSTRIYLSLLFSLTFLKIASDDFSETF